MTSTETVDNLFDIVEAFTDAFTTNKITFKPTKYKSSIDMYFHHEISGHITITLIFDSINLNVIPKDRKIGDLHLSKMINLNFTSLHTDNFIEVLEFSAKTIPSLTSYCVGCGTLLDIESKLYINCGEDKCVYSCEELPIGNIVCDFVKTKPTVAEFLLQTGWEAAKSTRRNHIFEPFPHYFMKTTEHFERGELSAMSTADPERFNSLKDFAKLDKTLTTYPFTHPINHIIKKLASYDTDLLLEADLTTDVYNLIRFFLMSAEFDINQVEIFTQTEFGALDTDKFRQYQFKHPPQKEKIFQTQCEAYRTSKINTCYLYHGSGRENWYSIMRNGLKVASHSKIMVNAAAYGSGIYTSNHFETSLHYTRAYGKQQCIMGVFEAASTTPDRWKKGSSIYVVPNACDLILRYILVVPPLLHSKIGPLLNTKFSKTLIKEKHSQKITTTKRSNKRLLIELKKMSSQEIRDELGYSAEIVDDDIYLWRVNLYTDKFDPDHPFTKSLLEYGISYVQFEMRFPERYPFEPPFVRVVSPRFEFRTGHITINGAICHQILAYGEWAASYFVSTLMTDIKCNILEGEAKLDKAKWDNPYSAYEAKADYERVMRSHGWK